MSDPDLWDAAFGRTPGADPFRPPRTPGDAWLAGVALGGRGHYAAAVARLVPLLTDRDPVLVALAAAALGSHRRQLGGHAAARVLDGRGLAALARAPADHPRLPEARSDVLLGLAADAVGLGRTARARSLTAAEADGPDPGWRGRIRRGWLAAEVELGAGRAAAALDPARAAHAAAVDSGSTRHRVKSAMVLGAALAAVGAGAEALPLVTGALTDAGEAGLLPLRWPCLLLLAALDPAAAARHAEDAERVLHCVLRHADPPGRELAVASPWLPTSDFVVGPNR
ncbi:hypothetical protein [Actinokineospora spheciospongiae]|uniref:hypothetical protein n=1 Tax=Actinokineospora spheciospongiae TaxID=909613 RepID=UPI0004B83A51|nr:hypothetical protein [Actinokineospora spheciospongiae]